MEKKIPKSVLAVMFVSVLSVCQTVSANELAKKEQWEYASTTPDGKYPELVTYTLGKMTGANNSNLPKGETYENNAYTRYLREYFNIHLGVPAIVFPPYPAVPRRGQDALRLGQVYLVPHEIPGQLQHVL